MLGYAQIVGAPATHCAKALSSSAHIIFIMIGKVRADYTSRPAMVRRCVSAEVRPTVRRCAGAVFALACGAAATALAASVVIPFSAAQPIVAALRADLIPADLRGKSRDQLSILWPRWASQ